ncbi:MAG TPA: hypothetical protein VGI61_05095 [Parafilimonas sp.]
MSKLPGLIFLLLLFFSFTAKAQQKDYHLRLFDTSVLKIPMPHLTQIGNYNHFDIYQSTPDNMIVIKPDSIIYFTMPNAVNQFIIQTPLIKPKKR